MGIRIYDKAAQDYREVSPEDATAGLTSGAYASQGEVLVGKDYETGTVPVNELQNYVAEGWAPITDEDANSRDLQREEKSIKGNIVGAVERAAAGTTLGLSSVALEALGVDPKRMKARAEGLGMLGEAIEIGAGVVGGGIGTMGKKAGQEVTELGVRHFLPTAGAEALGELGEYGTRKILGETAETGLGQVLQRVVPVGVRGAGEGFLFGVGTEIDESVLGERELQAERLLSAGGMGALFGAGAEVGLRVVAPGLLSGGGKVSKRGLQTVMGAAEGVTGSEKLARRLAKSQAALTGADEDALTRLWQGTLAADPRYSRMSSRGGVAKATDEISGAVKEGLDELIPLYQDARQVMAGAKLQKIDDLLPTTKDGKFRATMETAGVMDDIREQTRRLIAENDLGGMDARTLREVDQAVERAIRDVTEEQGAAAAFRAVDQMKRDIDDIVAPVWKTVRRSGDLDATRTAKAVSAINKQAREFLEDSKVWGDAGKFQAELNSALSGGMRAIDDADNLVGRMFKGQEVDPGQTLSLVRRVGRDIKGQQMGNDLESVLGAQERIFGVAEKYFDLDEAAVRRISQARDARTRVTKSLEERAELAAIADDFTSIRSTEGMDSVSLGRMGGGLAEKVISHGGIGAAIGGLPGAAVGAALGVGTTALRALRSPYTTIRTLGGIQDLLRKSDTDLQGILSRFMGGEALGGTGASVGAGTLPALAEGVGVDAAPGLLDVAAGRVRGAVKRAGAGFRESPEETHDRVKEKVPKYMGNPTMLTDAMDAQLWGMKQVAPLMADAMQRKAVTGAMFLASKMPPVYSPPMSNEELVDPVAQERFQRYVQGVEDPIGSLALLNTGALTSEHVEAIRTVWPELYQDMQRQIMARLAAADVEDRTISFDKRISLGTLFSAPTDQSLMPGAQARIQSAFAADDGEQPEGPQRRPRKGKTRAAAAKNVEFADRAETATDRVERGLT